MLAEQDGKCFLCKTREAKYMDHDHETGIARRPLCNECNMHLVGIELPDNWALSAMQYVASFKPKEEL
jgi:hypothetical protein